MQQTARIKLEDKERARRKRERILILITLVAVIVVTYLESQVITLAQNLPIGASFILFALINLNIVLLLLLLFLVFRNLVKLILESKRGIWGARLRTRLVVAFAVLSFAPSTVLFLAAFQFVGTSMDYWFNVQVESSLNEALALNQTFREQLIYDTSYSAKQIARQLEGYQPGKMELNTWLEERRELLGLSGLKMLNQDLEQQAFVSKSGLTASYFTTFPQDILARVQTRKEMQSHIQEGPVLNYAAVAIPIEKGKLQGVLIAYRLLPSRVAEQAFAIAKGLKDYTDLKLSQQPFKTQQYITLSIVALLVIFAAIWVGLYLARSITEPLMEVAEGTQRVAEGDYDFFINRQGPDEIGSLINAFNRMTADLKTSRARLDEAQGEMRRANLEMEQRRRYMEIVLSNVNAGVVAVDAKGIITAFNPSAERLLQYPASQALRRPWREIVDPENLPLAESILEQITPGRLATFDKQITLNIAQESLTLMFHVAGLYDENKKSIGVVVVFENLTELERAQRMAAWREVARRIAHEVKNPLTPIKLSAQRLIRRYEDKLSEDDLTIFRECTDTIVAQVEEIRNLVNDFSNFARLPNARLAPADLAQVSQEALNLFRAAHPDIEYILEISGTVPPFNFDKEQISRALINLLDNATSAVEPVNAPRLIVIRLSYDDILKIVRIEVEDNGIGVPPGLRLRLFEPYFSTKQGGTGLGLAIVSTIVADHNGYIRVQDNHPQGTRMVIELSVRGV